MNNSYIRNLTIWVGAGISMMSPSMLPSGNELTEFVLDQMVFGKDQILATWDQINHYEKNYIDTTEFPRLEVLLSSVAYIERFFHPGVFLKGFESFNRVPVNMNHLLLAALVHNGATIMTANFDLGIERAYKILYKHDLAGNEARRSKNNIFRCTESGGSVVHFHGTSSSGFDMGVTIENVTHFIDRTIYLKVRDSFKSGRYNYFFGYSFSDNYDINATIENLFSNTVRNLTVQNFVCNHRGMDTSLHKKVKTIFGEEKVKIISEDTTECLRTLCEEKSVLLPQNKWEEETANSNIPWRSLFTEKVNVNKKFQTLTTIHLLNRMKIAVDKVDKNILDEYEKLDIKTEKKMILEYHLAANSFYWYSKYGVTRLDTYHAGKLRERMIFSKDDPLLRQIGRRSISDVFKSIEEKDFVGYEDFSELTGRMKHIKMMLVEGYVPDNITEVRNMIDGFFRIPMAKYIENVLYASLLRYKMLIANIERAGTKEAEKAFQMANSLYYDIANIDGIISSHLDRIISENFRNSVQEWRKEFENVEWTELKNICKAVGSYRYFQFMEKIEKKHEL